ncbi:AAA family ATPase [Enterococcus sp. DIV0876]|uniref:AAA family ATPase n=1 Tax=Enterococcus sp. DIV0876 TaxID=2774633 RepID=UPI003D2FEEE5
MFESELIKINNSLLATSGINLTKEYDALLVKPLASTNLLPSNRETSSKQTHIALSGKNSQDFFPYVDIYHYTEMEEQGMKSFYVLQVPVVLDERNIKYADPSVVDFKFQNGKEIANGSVKLSRPGTSPQIELGNTSTSDDVFFRFRKLFFEKDFLVILKVKQKVEYEAYIIKAQDGVDAGLSDVVEFNMNRAKATIVNLTSITPSNSEKTDECENIVGKNVIYYGAPGTGKSFNVTKEIKKYYEDFECEDNIDAQFVFRTTLHPEYTYSDFVGQVMPNVEGESIRYDFVPGVFTRALERALAFESVNKPVFLVLEELSRANVAAVFGDLFQLLDREQGKSEYSISNSVIAQSVYHANSTEYEILNRKIYLPRNLFILGTVNTNDQNVFVMDTAFKRRFEWKYISTKPVRGENGEELNNPTIMIDKNTSIKWWDFYQKLNHYITRDMGLGEDKQVGQFFIKFVGDSKSNQEQLQNKLLQYLWDDLHQVSFKKKLFGSITSYSDLYDAFAEGEAIFVDEFLTSLDTENVDII